MDIGKDHFYISLINPLLSFLIYRGLYLLFVKTMEREPIDTAFNMSFGLYWDRAFNLTYVFTSTIGLMLFNFYLMDHL